MTLDEARARGYTFKNHGTCNKCGQDIEWWENQNRTTLPPINPMNRGSDTFILHKETCSG